jgi:tetratricopeptide (TPR) repeat protein
MNRFLLDIFVPLLHSRADAPGYTIFSPTHLLDMLNQNLLLTPVGLALLLCLVTVYKQKIKLRDQFLIFMIIVSLAQILYHAVADPKFGAVRDWDLFSGVSVGFTLIGVYLFITLARSEKYSAVVLIFTAFLSVTPWFFVNISTEKAIAHLSDLLDIDPQRSFSGRYVLFTYYKEHNEPEKAKETETRVFSVFPEAYLVRLAQIYMNQGSLDTAEVMLKRALAINPRFPGTYNDLGRIYFEKGKLDEAISLFRGGLQQDPFSKVFYQNLGLAFIQKGNLQDGVEALEKAVKLGAKDASIYTDIANANARLGDREKALKAYKKAIKLDPTFWVARLNLGQLYLRLNSVDEAQVEFEQVLKLKPSHLPVYYYLGVTYSYKGMKDRAIESFELFLKNSPETPQKQQARTWLKQLQAQKP